MIQRSFHQFQKDRDSLQVEEQKRDLELELSKVEDLSVAVKDETHYDFNMEEAIADHYYVAKERDKKQEEVRQIITQPENIAPFLNPGRLVHVNEGETDWGWGILIAASRRKLGGAGGAEGDAEAESSEAQWVLDVF